MFKDSNMYDDTFKYLAKIFFQYKRFSKSLNLVGSQNIDLNRFLRDI